MSRVDAVAARQISTPERQHIFDEAGGMCEYCREQPARRVDHVVPVSKGGTSDRENLKAACVPCNDDKFDDTPEQWRERRLAVGLSWPPDWSADLRAMLEDQGLLPSQREGTLRQSKAV
jgi:5-methylcytosine-specific restriction endonuclease McrA